METCLKTAVEELYAAGAVNMDITFAETHLGLEATPPLDKNTCGRILAVLKSHNEQNEGWGEEDDQTWAPWPLESSSTDLWTVPEQKLAEPMSRARHQS